MKRKKKTKHVDLHSLLPVSFLQGIHCCFNGCGTDLEICGGKLWFHRHSFILSSPRHSERAETELLMKGGGEEGLFFLHFI